MISEDVKKRDDLGEDVLDEPEIESDQDEDNFENQWDWLNDDKFLK